MEKLSKYPICSYQTLWGLFHADRKSHLQLPDSVERFPGCHSLPKGPQGVPDLEQPKLAASVANVMGTHRAGI